MRKGFWILLLLFGIYLISKKDISPSVENVDLVVQKNETSASKIISKKVESNTEDFKILKTIKEPESVMTDEEFMRLEILNAQNELEESEIVYCNVTHEMDQCRRSRFVEEAANEEICLTAKRFCYEIGGFPSEIDLLNILNPEEVVNYLAEREKTRKYILNPLSDYEAVNERYFQGKLEELVHIDTEFKLNTMTPENP